MNHDRRWGWSNRKLQRCVNWRRSWQRNTDCTGISDLRCIVCFDHKGHGRTGRQVRHVDGIRVGTHSTQPLQLTSVFEIDIVSGRARYQIPGDVSTRG